MTLEPAYFDSLFTGDDDPWKFRSRWYEARKRALTLACLPAPRYANGFEPGCANGELSAALAGRCTRLLVSDGSSRAVTLARTRLASMTHVRVLEARMPAQWPDERFDLVVISELGYFLSGADLDALATKLKGSLCDDATVLACHWRPQIEGCELDGDAVNERLNKALDMPHLSRLLEPDLRLDVWCRNPLSVGQREGLW